MNKTTKNSFLKAACLMLSVIMLTAYVLPETLAKYTSSGTVSAEGMTLTVAKWDVQVDGEPLEDTITVTNTEWVIDSPYEAGLTNAAPGTWGYSKVCTITNAGEVDAKVTISNIDALKEPTPSSGYNSGLGFEVVVKENEDTPSSFGEPSDIDIETIDSEGVVLTSGDSMTIYVCYEWEFDVGSGANDDTDTTMGEEQDTFTFGGTLTVTAVQAG